MMAEVRVLSSCTCCPNEPSGFCEMPGCECPCCVMEYADAVVDDLVQAEARATRAEARVTELEQAVAGLAGCVQTWEKFAWYASGESGHAPLKAPLFQSLVSERARGLGKEALLHPAVRRVLAEDVASE